MKKLIDILDTTAGRLIFALASGCGYFMILLRAIVYFSNGKFLLGFFFAPAIIFGAAILIIKLLRQYQENKNEISILRLFFSHLILILIGVVFLVATIKA